jgi:hypothetical protein
MEEKKRLEIDNKMEEAATKIQRMFRRRKEGKGMILHLKDLMKRLVEAEKAKMRLNDMLSCMQDETTKYWFSYLNKNIDVRKISFNCSNIENHQNSSFLQGKDSPKEVRGDNQKDHFAQ